MDVVILVFSNVYVMCVLLISVPHKELYFCNFIYMQGVLNKFTINKKNFIQNPLISKRAILDTFLKASLSSLLARASELWSFAMFIFICTWYWVAPVLDEYA